MDSGLLLDLPEPNRSEVSCRCEHRLSIDTQTVMIFSCYLIFTINSKLTSYNISIVNNIRQRHHLYTKKRYFLCGL
jgi:hypothetical protein